jgi:hypothetical protein
MNGHDQWRNATRTAALLVAGGLMLAWTPLLPAAKAEVVKASPELTIFTRDESRQQAAPAGDRRPTVLRGSAVRRGVARGYRQTMAPERWVASSGETLWLTDPASGEVVACRVKRTSRVGKRVIRCIADDLPQRVYD